MRSWLSAGLALALMTATGAEAQQLARRIDAVRDGTVRFAYAARPGVCGDGHHNISFSRADRDGEWESDCEDGPVRVAVDRAGGRTIAVRAYVGGHWRGTGALDLGTVSCAEAAGWLLGLAERDEQASEDAVFPAVIADSVVVWPALLRIARNPNGVRKTRKSAIFWLGQAAEDAATTGLDSVLQDPHGDREVRESAIFALSQRPKAEGVPALIRFVHTSHDPKLRRTALFWLGQTEDSAALALFEELLTKR
jgi:hypothetical protein